MKIHILLLLFVVFSSFNLWSQSANLCNDIANTRTNLQNVISLSVHFNEDTRNDIFNEIRQHSPVNVTSEVEKRFFMSMVFAVSPQQSLTAEEAEKITDEVDSRQWDQALSMLSTFIIRPVVRRGAIATASRLSQARLISFVRSIAAPTLLSGVTLGGVFVLENLVIPSRAGSDTLERMGEQLNNNIALVFMLPNNEACRALSVWGPAQRKFNQIKRITDFSAAIFERKLLEGY